MLVYGRNVAIDLLKKKKNIKKIILQDGFNDDLIFSLIENNNYRVEYRSKKEIDDLCSGVHQGIILDIPDFAYDNINDFLERKEEFVVVLDHLYDPNNLSDMIRTCEEAGVKSIIIPKDRQVLINSTVMKTSVGTLDNIHVVLVSNISNSIDILKDNGFWVVGTALENSIDYRQIDYSGKIALIIGKEGAGM